jgi:hypothetical protein
MELKTFDTLFTESVEECFTEVLGMEASDTIFQYLASQQELSRAAIPQDLSRFHQTLFELLGSMTQLLEDHIVRTLIRKLQIPFEAPLEASFSDQIDAVKRQISE